MFYVNLKQNFNAKKKGDSWILGLHFQVTK
jgi:hypothetical protein